MRLSLSLKYILSTTAILLVVMGVTLGIVARRHEQLVLAQIEMQAKGLFKQIVITRRWVADHGGIFVEKLPWVEPNPYLPDSMITDVTGKRYVKENPALVTRKLSLYAEREGMYYFHITSLKLVNPGNAPDEFEAAALRDFEAGRRAETTAIEKRNGSSRFRYIAPLYVEESCLSCHAEQGYRVGQVRGAISVSLPMDYAAAMISSDRRYMLAGAAGTALVVMLALFAVTRQTVIKPVARMRRLMHKFSRDGDPAVPLLRTGDELEDLSASFRDMARAIDEYHSSLQDKIGAATRELTEKNEALQRLNRAHSDFIAKISHELRTPLTSIKGAMDYLAARLAMPGREEHRDLTVFLDMVKHNADRLIRLVSNVLDYERIGLGQFEMRFAAVNLRETFAEVVAGFRPLSEKQGVQVSLTAEEVRAQVDEDRIKQVLTNLLSNALHFSPAGSVIAVTLRATDAGVEAAVQDQGCGVPDGERERIFEQFYTRGVKDGTGLGLAICRGIVEAHGGEIGVESGGAGGSRFWFRLPLPAPGERADAAATADRG
ncbi:MAG: ATP-binding protein [Candidatus Methylomirabilales bacterium]